MAREPTRRRLTGRLRRNNKRRVSSYRRAMHLSHAQVGFRHLLQNFMVHDGSAARSTLYMLTPLLLLTFIIHNNVTNPTDVNLAATAISFLLRVQYAHHVFKRDRFLRWLRHDQILHDIPLEEEEAAEPHRMPRQDVRFDSWSSQECMDNTSFKRINDAPSTIILASPILHLQLRMVGSTNTHQPVGFETITSIPKSYSYFS